MRPIPFILILCFLTGCIAPHRTMRSQEIGGKVLDERTHGPIQGASISLVEHPEVSCKSSSDGSYVLKATHNWHIGYRIPIVEWQEWPSQTTWSPYIAISHTNYLPRAVNLDFQPAQTILLERINEPAKAGTWLIFNGDGAILQDMGAARYLKQDGIHIGFKDDGKPGWRPSDMQIEFNRPISTPHITPLRDFDKATFQVGNGEGFKWKITVRYWDWSGKFKDEKNASRLYRLEFKP
jgi:hypothetical protein